MKKNIVLASGAVLLFILGLVVGMSVQAQLNQQPSALVTPFLPEKPPPELPLLRYTIQKLTQYPFQASNIVLEEKITETDEFVTYQFMYTTMDKKMTGQLNLPTPLPDNPKVIILLRGYVPPEIYQTGVGTKNAAAVFAQHGYITLAPDFFGFGDSDPDFEDTWEARFIKPINVIELIKSVREVGIPVGIDGVTAPSAVGKTSQDVGIWAHSNGGQIALTTLEVLSEPIPTTLWAPVTAPFPYSILFFGDELEDEGKEQRAWIALFEKNYNVLDFSLTQYLHRLTGPLQIHHGTSDDAALYSWSQEFVGKLTHENERREIEREELAAQSATQSANPEESAQPLESIEHLFFTYPGANHNLQPGWDSAIERDLSFFETHLR